MKKWEYEFTYDVLFSDLTDVWGEQGWELVTILNKNNKVMFMFKREKK